jgi:predicted peptidase
MKTFVAVLAFVVLLAIFAWAVRPEVSLPLEPLVFKDKDGRQLPYRLMKPDGYDAGKKYPLVVFLHGAGERGTDNAKQMTHGVPQFASKENRAEYPCFLIAPQCPANVKWVDVDWSAASHTIPKEMTEPARLTIELIEAIAKEFSIDKKRIYITGLSMGGFGTWDLVARYPDLFAAAVPVCGGADEATAEKIKNLPIWAFHGGKDGVVKTVRSRNIIAALEKAGGKPKYVEYPNIGHDAWNPAYKDAEMFKWLFAQTKE